MALCDYRLCDVCGGKAFYDAELSYRDEPGGELLPGYVGAWGVICTTCAETHEVVVRPKLPAESWQPFATVPKDRVVDLWATYPAATPNSYGAFNPRRWADCYWTEGEGGWRWQGLPTGWVPTHWRDQPQPPEHKNPHG